MRSICILVALFAAACAGPRITSNERLEVIQASELPPPPQFAGENGERPYLIGPFDKLQVDVFDMPQLSKEVQADSTGSISIPLAGEIRAAGHTPAELARLIEERLRAGYIRDPHVSVNLVETVSQTVTVDGEVEAPGLYPTLGRMTLMRAIARAGGATEYARTSHVVVFRTVEGQDFAGLYDLRAIRQGLYEDPEIYPHDIVVVGEARALRVFDRIVRGSGLISAPIVALIR